MKAKKIEARTRFTRQNGKRSLLEGIPKGLSSLALAYQVTEKAATVGFDWPEVKGILKKLDEEIEELRRALSLRGRNRIREEIGDLLFVMVNLARFLKIDPEVALGRTVKKFTSRFAYIERSLQRKGKTLRESNLLEMDHLWEEAKKRKLHG